MDNDFRDVLAAVIGGEYWFVRGAVKRAASDALRQLDSLGQELDGVQTELNQKKKDFDSIKTWRLLLENAQAEVRESAQKQRGVEKRVTALEQELADVQSRYDDIGRVADAKVKRAEAALRKKEEDHQTVVAAISKDAEYWLAEHNKVSAQASADREFFRSETRRLGFEMDELKSREANACRAYDAAERLRQEAMDESQKLQRQLDAAFHDIRRLQAILATTESVRDRYLETMTAVALHAKQVQVMLEESLVGKQRKDESCS